MNLVRDLPPIKPNLPQVTDPADLTVLTAPDCPVAIWSRQHSEALSVWLDRLPASQLPRWRETVVVEEVSDTRPPQASRHQRQRCRFIRPSQRAENQNGWTIGQRANSRE